MLEIYFSILTVLRNLETVSFVRRVIPVCAVQAAAADRVREMIRIVQLNLPVG